MSDYKRTGYPDLSYHSSEAWISDVKGNARAVGMMYSESYAGEEDAEETFLYIGYNFYMGLQVFAPFAKAAKGKALVSDYGYFADVSFF